MKNLAHSASFHPVEKIAPSKHGIKHLATAINNYRNHDGGSEIFNVNDTNSNLDKNKTRTLNNPDFQPPPSSTDEPYDRRDYDRLTREGHSGEVAYEASKELFQQRKRGIFPSISPGNEEGTSNFSADQDRPTKRGKGVTSPQIPKLKDRPHPPGMSRTDFGDKVLKWRGSPDEILRRRSEINASEIERMKAAGTTKSMIESWFNIYQNDFSRNNNYVALTRMKLMQKILNYWED
ncbi:DUF4951 domain-containing protein [Labrys sp. KB_33_2]|uniref:DUF4951 domain-containing protein n=1 Tax=Labrys sp. KB_33_2 TaxID=3237479 RepID=UPI003F919E82